MNTIIRFCTGKFSKQVLNLTFICLTVIFTMASHSSQATVSNGISCTSSSSDAPSNGDGNKSRHAKSGPTVTLNTGPGMSDTMCVSDLVANYTIKLSGNISGGTTPYTYQWTSTNGTAVGVTTSDTVTLFWTAPTIEYVILA